MNRRLVTGFVGVIAAGVLAGCSPDSEASSTSSPTQSPAGAANPSSAQPTSDPSEPAGKVVTDVVTSFRCAADTEGKWSASGRLTNSTSQNRSYRVTVYVGTADEGRARATRVSDVPAGGAKNFSFKRVPSPAAAGPCRIRVEQLA